ncbi:MAG TPA: PQQ-binding-like beta-propeller repeat protein [Gemmataceae bacterium]|nr:PQQ-binding-like beta-propeller repeat protein [Gemmataceae bacterium]
MKRLAWAMLGATIAAASLTSLATAQPARSRLFSTPLPPPREVLDRLNLQMSWRIYVPMDGRHDGLATVQLHGTDLYVQTRSGMVALLDAETGVTHWRTRVGLPYRVEHEVAFNSREVYVINSTFLYALDRKTGAMRWQYHLREGVAAPPVADEDQIYIAAPTGRLTAYFLPRPDLPSELPPGFTEFYDLKSVKEEKAAKETPEQRRKRIVSIKGETRSSAGTVSYLTPSARDASTEEETGVRPVRVWSEVTRLRLEFPILQTREKLLLPAPDGVVVAIDRLPQANGAAAETYRFAAESPIRVPGAHYEDMAIVGAEDANVYALQVSNGKLRWRFTAGTPISRKPAITDEDVYVVAARKGMTRLDRATGEPRWRIPVGRELVENNAAADRFLAVNPKYVYATDASGRFLILERRRGVVLSGFDTKDFVFPVSNEVTDRVYLAANNGLIVCLHDREYQKPIRHRLREEQAENPLRIRLATPVPELPAADLALRLLLVDWTRRFPPLQFRIDEQAFQAAGVESPAGAKVKLPKVENKPLGEVIKGVLDQVKSKFEIVGDTLVIVPADAAP